MSTTRRRARSALVTTLVTAPRCAALLVTAGAQQASRLRPPVFEVDAS